jgi:hypothetical protein
LLAKNGLPRELDAIAFDRKHLHENLVALTKFIFYFLDPMFSDLRYMKQSISAGEYLNERSKLSETDDLAEIGLSDLRNSSKIADHLNSTSQTVCIA